MDRWDRMDGMDEQNIGLDGWVGKNELNRLDETTNGLMNGWNGRMLWMDGWTY